MEVTILEAIDASKRYDAVTALNGVSIAVAKGGCTALVGESGSGKSTLLRTFNRMVEPDAGTARVSGFRGFSALPIRRRRRIGLWSS